MLFIGNDCWCVFEGIAVLPLNVQVLWVVSILGQAVCNVLMACNAFIFSVIQFKEVRHNFPEYMNLQTGINTLPIKLAPKKSNTFSSRYNISGVLGNKKCF